MRIIDKIANNALQTVRFEDFADEYYKYHKNGTVNYFDRALNNLVRWTLSPSPYPNEYYDFISSLINDFENIIKATPSQIEGIISKYSSGRFADLLSIIDYTGKKPKRKQTAFGKEIEEMFCYSDFRDSSKASWYCTKLPIKACVYCNAQYALAIGREGTKKKLLFQLDHFYSKSIYPYLSLTMGNLVPSCSTCNNSKSNIGFTLATHIHPYNEDINTLFDFKADEENLLKFLLGDRNIDLLKTTMVTRDSRIDNHEKVFSLKHIYEKHTDVIEELILRKMYYNASKIEELKREFSELNFTQSTIDRFILGTYSLESEINNRPLVKLSRDIAKQLKLNS